MSFSSDIKEELVRISPKNLHCKKSELIALLRINGSVSPQRGVRLLVRTENVVVARRVFTLVRDIYGVKTEIQMEDGRRLQKKHAYTMVLQGEDARFILLDTAIMGYENGMVTMLPFSEDSLSRRCCRAAFLRGCFLACGSLSNPEKLYHLEFVLQNEALAQSICKILESFGLAKAKTIERKGAFVVYLKDGESIADFLTIVGANNGTLELENIRVLKDVRNNVNRAVNCETANLQKTVVASLRQVENIAYIQEHLSLEKLPPKLREIAEVRLNHPDATLAELSSYLSEPLGKSGINHRLRRLDEIAHDLRIKRGEL